MVAGLATTSGLLAQAAARAQSGSLRLEVGDKLEYILESATKHRFEGRNQRGKAFPKDAGHKRRCITQLKLRVDSVTADGEWRVKAEIARVAVEFPFPGAPITLDTAKPEVLSAAKAALVRRKVWKSAGEPLASFAGRKFEFLLDRYGEVSKLRGISEDTTEDTRNARDHASLLLIGSLSNDRAWQRQLQALLFGGVPTLGARVLDEGWKRRWTMRPFDPSLRIVPRTKASGGAVRGVFSTGGLAAHAAVVAAPEAWECTASFNIGKPGKNNISTSFQTGSVVLPSKRRMREEKRQAAQRRDREEWLKAQQTWGHDYTNPLAQEVEGVPESLRGQAWRRNLGNPLAPGQLPPGGVSVLLRWNRDIDSKFPGLVDAELSPLADAGYRLRGRCRLSSVDGMPQQSEVEVAMSLASGRAGSVWTQRWTALRMSSPPARAESLHLPSAYYSLDHEHLASGQGSEVRSMVEKTDVVLAMHADGKFDLFVVSGSAEFGIDGLWFGDFKGSWVEKGSDEVQLKVGRQKAKPPKRGTGEVWAPWVARRDNDAAIMLHMRQKIVTKRTGNVVFTESPPAVLLVPCDRAEFDRAARRARNPKGVSRERLPAPSRIPCYLRDFSSWHRWFNHKAIKVVPESDRPVGFAKGMRVTRALWWHCRRLVGYERGEFGRTAIWNLSRRLVSIANQLPDPLASERR